MKSINTSQNIIIGKKGDGKKLKSQELLENLNSVSNEEIGSISSEIEAKIKEKKEKWRKETLAKMEKRIKMQEEQIIRNIREYNVRTINNQEMFGVKGKIVTLDLPKVGDFKGFKFSYFVSNDTITKGTFEKIPLFKKESKFEKQSYTLKEICELMDALRKFIEESDLHEDCGMDYEKELKYWETQKTKCHVGKFLKSILGLDDTFWLKDKNVDGKEKSRVRWDCQFTSSTFFYYCVDNDCKGKLLLKVNE